MPQETLVDFLTFDPFGVALIAFLLGLSAFFLWAAWKGEDEDGGLGPVPFDPRPTPPVRRPRHNRGGPSRKHDRGPSLPGQRTQTRV